MSAAAETAAAEPGVVYISPLGKRCMLVPPPPKQRRWPWLLFRYLDSSGEFPLSDGNVRYLRKAAP